MKTYYGIEIQRNELSGNIDWISPKMIIENLSDAHFKTTFKGKREITSIKDEIYEKALLKFNILHDTIVEPYNFLLISKEEFKSLSKSFYDKTYKY